MPKLDLTDEEQTAVAAAMRRLIDEDKFPFSPRLAPLKSALAKLDPPKPKALPPPPILPALALPRELVRLVGDAAIIIKRRVTQHLKPGHLRFFRDQRSRSPRRTHIEAATRPFLVGDDFLPSTSAWASLSGLGVCLTSWPSLRAASAGKRTRECVG